VSGIEGSNRDIGELQEIGYFKRQKKIRKSYKNQVDENEMRMMRDGKSRLETAISSSLNRITARDKLIKF
jgi:hypothetical protein